MSGLKLQELDPAGVTVNEFVSHGNIGYDIR